MINLRVILAAEFVLLFQALSDLVGKARALLDPRLQRARQNYIAEVHACAC